MTKSKSTQARMPVLLNIRIFAARDDFFQPIPYLCLWGRMASCGRLEIGLLLISRKLRQADLQSAAGYQPALHLRIAALWHIYREWLRMKFTTGVGSFGASGKCPSPSLMITVICPPSSL